MARKSSWMRAFRVGKQLREVQPRKPAEVSLDADAEPIHPWTAQKEFFPEDTWDQFRPLEQALRSEDGHE